MNRHDIIDEAVTQISKDKNIPEHEVGTYDITLKLADRVVDLLSSTEVNQQRELLNFFRDNWNKEQTTSGTMIIDKDIDDCIKDFNK